MNKFQKIITLCAVEFVFLFFCLVISLPFISGIGSHAGKICAFLAVASWVLFLNLAFFAYRQKEEKK